MNSPKPKANTAVVVDDNADERELAATLLGELGLNVVEVQSAEAAIAVMERIGGDVAMIFSEAALPGAMDGAELARAVSVIWPRTTVMITSDTSHVPRLPPVTTWVPKPWRGLDVIVAAEHAMNSPPPAVS